MAQYVQVCLKSKVIYRTTYDSFNGQFASNFIALVLCNKLCTENIYIEIGECC